jgi:hypothetical protein
MALRFLPHATAASISCRRIVEAFVGVVAVIVSEI